MNTNIITLADTSWTQVVNNEDEFTLSTVAGPGVRYFVTSDNVAPTEIYGHPLKGSPYVNGVPRAIAGTGYIWVRSSAPGAIVAVTK